MEKQHGADARVKTGEVWHSVALVDYEIWRKPLAVGQKIAGRGEIVGVTRACPNDFKTAAADGGCASAEASDEKRDVMSVCSRAGGQFFVYYLRSPGQRIINILLREPDDVHNLVPLASRRAT